MRRLMLLLTIAGPILGATPDDTAIRARLAECNAGFNERNTQVLRSCYSPGADMRGDETGSDGKFLLSRDAVLREIARQRSSWVFGQATRTLTVEKVRILGDGVAITDCSFTLSGARYEDGKPMPSPVEGFLTIVMVKEDGKWVIASSRSAQRWNTPTRLITNPAEIHFGGK
jgi:hypothetical protein